MIFGAMASPRPKYYKVVFLSFKNFYFPFDIVVKFLTEMNIR